MIVCLKPTRSLPCICRLRESHLRLEHGTFASVVCLDRCFKAPAVEAACKRQTPQSDRDVLTLSLNPIERRFKRCAPRWL